MTTTTHEATTDSGTTGDVKAEVTAWLERNWDPDLTVAEWWERLADSGWAVPTWPVEWHGRGLSRSDGLTVHEAITEFGALASSGGLGTILAAPTIIVHGTDEQRRRYLRATAAGQVGWCQLFSEPSAGSDLAGLNTRAELDGDEWVVNGQKVWTSAGQWADLGILLARTDPNVPKHQGITYFVCNMHQPGVDIRPLRELTGRAIFNEVFLTDVRVPADAAIGGINNGWAVANTTLMFERSGIGAGTVAGVAALPGSLAGDLDQRAGDYVNAPQRLAGGAVVMTVDNLAALARTRGTLDATVRQDLAQLHSMKEIARFMDLRQQALAATGRDIPGIGNLGKLSMSRILRFTRDLSGRILGPYATLHAYNATERDALDAATHTPGYGAITESLLFSAAPPIYGGTDEIQHNILGERVLGLPKEPGPDRTTPFRDLPKNG